MHWQARRQLGIEEMEDEGALLVVEWAEKLGRHRRDDAPVVRFEVTGPRRSEPGVCLLVRHDFAMSAGIAQVRRRCGHNRIADPQS